MTRSDLITALATRINVTQKQAIDIINLIFDGFTEALVKDGRIEIRGFGVFVVKNYRSYTGRNPKTGKEIEVKPKRMALFKTGKELKERVDL